MKKNYKTFHNGKWVLLFTLVLCSGLFAQQMQMKTHGYSTGRMIPINELATKEFSLSMCAENSFSYRLLPVETQMELTWLERLFRTPNWVARQKEGESLVRILNNTGNYSAKFNVRSDCLGQNSEYYRIHAGKHLVDFLENFYPGSAINPSNSSATVYLPSSDHLGLLKDFEVLHVNFFVDEYLGFIWVKVNISGNFETEEGKASMPNTFELKDQLDLFAEEVAYGILEGFCPD
ncbi:MAG TPA: hypothetical protein ENJ82_18460 [Bacteroidetes bacterium]|nr:hypothetical protein [Bacteroidota bacterium]